jgi:hypothetical protein
MAVDPRTLFSPNENKIFATFDTSQYAGDKVLVKWFHIDQPSIFLFEKFPINTNNTYNYVSFNKPGGWPTGRYSVAIHSVDVDDNLGLIASGQYEIW